MTGWLTGSLDGKVQSYYTCGRMCTLILLEESPLDIHTDQPHSGIYYTLLYMYFVNLSVGGGL